MIEMLAKKISLSVDQELWRLTTGEHQVEMAPKRWLQALQALFNTRHRRRIDFHPLSTALLLIYQHSASLIDPSWAAGRHAQLGSNSRAQFGIEKVFDYKQPEASKKGGCRHLFS